jgi:hypothetical protein
LPEKSIFVGLTNFGGFHNSSGATIQKEKLQAAEISMEEQTIRKAKKPRKMTKEVFAHN